MNSPLKSKSNKQIEQHYRSEITLYDLHQSMLDKEEADIDAILQSYNVEDRKHLIIDRTKGKIFDSRLENIDSIMNYPMRMLNMTTKLQSSPPDNKRDDSFQNIRENQLEMGARYKQKCAGNHRVKSRSVWDSNWKEVEKVHQKFLESICRNNSTNFFAFLDKKKNQIPIDINYKFQSNWSPIHYSAMHSSVLILSRLINHQSIDVNALTDFGETPLHIAAKVNKYENCQLLINAGVCIDYKDKDQNTALHYAAQLGYEKLIKILIKNNASTEIKNNHGLTAVELCTLTDLAKLFPKPIASQKQQVQDNYLFKHRNNHRNMIERMLLITNKNENCPEKESTTALELKKSVLKGRKKNILKLYELIKEQNKEPITLSTFQFYKKIGEGAFGQVYIVKKVKSERLYALKAIKKERVFGTSLYRYIQTEKEILSLINHPFIVRLHYAFQTEAYLFLVMDYCEGGDLSKVLEKKKRFQQKVVKIYAAQILLGIEALHQNKIIYRDLKPQNIVLDKDGHALITDFGLSKKTQNLNDINKSFCGTPAYLPLQIINKKGHNRMVDWYEFGIVLYELLTGFPPFYAETKAELYDVVRQGVIRFPKNTPDLFRDLIKKLLAQNPQKRLGFVDDAESIKEHPWFTDVDWDAVLDRRQVMPPIQNKVKLGQPIRTKFHDIKCQKFQIPAWSFIS